MVLFAEGTMSCRRQLRRVLGVIAVLALVGGTAWAVDSWWFRAELSRAQREMDERHYGPARERLGRLSAHRPASGEVHYWLGLCERALGHLDAAVAAWARVPWGAPEAGRAAVAAAEVQWRRGRLAPAEDLLRAARCPAGPPVPEATQMLANILSLQGRVDEVRPLIPEMGMDRDPAVELLRLWKLENDPYPIEGLRTQLEDAARKAPKDDRVWLGRANLAIRTGQHAQAAEWLDACRRRRPTDPVVVRAWLDWALAANRPDEVERALSYLRASALRPAEAAALRAEFAARRGDDRAEQVALTAILEQKPGDARAIERLAELALRTDDFERVAQLRRRKSELDRARDRYQKVLAL